MKISAASVYFVRRPFRMDISHSLATHNQTGNIVVRLVGDDGLSGWGEGVPRDYVTGETAEASLAALEKEILPMLINTRGLDGFFQKPDRPGGPDLMDPDLVDRFPGAWCAVETACWDLLGRGGSCPVSDLLGGAVPRPLTYSAVLPRLDRKGLTAILDLVRTMGMTEIKIKVGHDGDLEDVARVRETLGPDVDLRVDANGAWTVEEAIEKVERMGMYGVSAVEQPTPGDDPAGLARVRRAVDCLVLADESLITIEDARKLIRMQAVHGFNLKLSKCGGPTRTRAIQMLAAANGLLCQLGSQVGELGILGAMGRHFASVGPPLMHLEGCLARYYLSQDIIVQDIGPGRHGRAATLSAPGLSVDPDEKSLADSLVLSM